ncbi:DUF2231 domain-containing protein [Actinosynnema pretiosum]|uniref:DUF2231 domain-containing protein n=1 Tax=Actinosynnema pretiosum TaxID=42197 RepID=A0A290Z153_9PSEU|nr:DUF2231 domain-containing protein [Actinosynnema pretiosum]ATE52734.1 DUF2231 domain-containing protein [Actinosynnema pretiosum]
MLPLLRKFTRRVERSEALDRAAAAIAEFIPPQLRDHRVTTVLRGKFLGHPLHPIAVMLPIGMYAASAVLDVAPGESKASRALIGIGLASTPVAVASGLAEFTSLEKDQRRAAVAHLAFNGGATLCYLTSFRLRGHGFGVVARGVSLLGLTLIGVGGYLGGHLTYAQGAGVGREAGGWEFSQVGTSTAAP